MGAMQQGGKPEKVNAAKQQLNQLLTKYKIEPEVITRLAQAANMAMKDKALYPMFVQQAKQSGIPGAEQLSAKIDYQKLGQIIAIGKLMEA